MSAETYLTKIYVMVAIPALFLSLNGPLLAQDSEHIIEGQVLQVGAAPEGLTYDPKTGDYTLIYKTTDINDKEYLYKTTFIPATKIEPDVASHFDKAELGTFHYRYTVSNGKKAAQAVHSIMMMIPNPIVSNSLGAPKDWKASEVQITGYLGPAARETGRLGFNIAWYPQRTAEMKISIRPGMAKSGFVYESDDLPGVGVARLRGYVGKVLGLAGEGPDPDSEVGKKFNQLDENNFVTRHVALPKIPLSKPFDAAIVLSALQKHVKEEITSMALVEPSFADQLDRSLIAAIEAAKRGNNDGLRAQLKDIRQMLKKEHSDLDDKSDAEHENRKKSPNKRIDKLAARVLDFDIKYVLKTIHPEEKDK